MVGKKEGYSEIYDIHYWLHGLQPRVLSKIHSKAQGWSEWMMSEGEGGRKKDESKTCSYGDVDDKSTDTQNLKVHTLFAIK